MRILGSDIDYWMQDERTYHIFKTVTYVGFPLAGELLLVHGFCLT